MHKESGAFVGDIPENYDRYLGPVLFAGHAADLARRAGRHKAQAVLEVAAGTGILSRKLRDTLPDGVRLTVSDLNPPMLEIARGKFTADEAVEFRQADALKLPFPDGAFDLVVCQFGVMFFPDKVAALRETRRVLCTGGRTLFNVWGPIEANPFAQLADNVAARYFPDNPPGFYKVPFSYHDANAVARDLEAAGFDDIACEVLRSRVNIADWAPFAHGMVYGNPLLDEIRARSGVDPEHVVATILDELRARLGQEPAQLPLEATVFEARRQ